MPDPGVGVTGTASASPGAACDGTAEGLVAATVVAVVIRGGATGDAFFAGTAANATGLGRSTALGDSRLLALASSTFTSGRAGSRTSTLSAGRNAEVGGGTTTPNASQRAKKCTPADNSRNRPIRQNDCRYALGKALTPHAVALKSVSESTAMSPKGSHSMLPDGPPGAAFCLMSRAGRPGGASTRRLAAAAPRQHGQSLSAEIDPHQKQCLVRRYATFRNATSLPRMPG